MQSHTPAEKNLIEKMIVIFEDEVEAAIDLLESTFNYYRGDLDEMTSYDIVQLLEKELLDSEFSFIREELEYTEHFIDFDFSIKESATTEGEMRQPCKNPCSTCPYTKNALKGYFGGNDPQEYADAIHRDTIVACHSRTKHDEITQEAKSEGDITICTGHIVSQIKVCKNPQHPEGKKAHDFVRSFTNLEELKDNALAFDFKAFHGIQ